MKSFKVIGPKLRVLAVLGGAVCLILSVGRDSSAAGDPNQSNNGIYVQVVKTYDEGALEALLASATKTLSALTGFDQPSLSKALGQTQGATINQATTAFTLSGPGGTAPSTSIPASPSLPTNASVSSGDLLNEQLQLSLQIINLQLLLGGSLNDQSPQGDTHSPKRKRTTLGFPIYITVPPGFKYQEAVAEVEVSVCTPSDAATLGPPTLVNLLPQEKTYNVASLVSKGASIGGGGIAGIINVGGSFMRGRQTYYLVHDQDTLAMQRSPRGTCASGSEPVTFAWQFRPVLGQKVVRDGLRQTFAQISFPGSLNALGIFGKCPSGVTVRSCWRRYDRNTGRVGPVIDKVQERALLATNFSGPPAPELVSAEDNGDGTLTVKVAGSFWNGTAVRIGSTVQTDGSAGFEHNSTYIRFKTDALSLALNGAYLLNKDGSESPVKYPPDPDFLFDPSTCVEAAPPGSIRLSQHEGIQGQSLSVTITGNKTRFVPGQVSLVSKPPGSVLRADPAEVINSERLKFNLTIPEGAQLGQYDVMIPAQRGSLPAGSFMIAGKPPGETSLTVFLPAERKGPPVGQQGETLILDLFVPAATWNPKAPPTVTFSGTGAMAGAATVPYPNVLRFSLTIAADAAGGPRDVTVSDAGKNSTYPALFTVRPAVEGTPFEVTPFNEATSLIRLVRDLEDVPRYNPSLPEVAVIGPKVFGLRDNPFYERAADHVSFLVPNDLIRTNRRVVWTNLITAKRQAYDLASSHGAFAISDFAISSITPLSSPAASATSTPTAPVLSNGTVTTKDTAGGTQIASGTALFAVGNGKPSIIAISQASGAPGDALSDVLITGAFTHFTQAPLTVLFSDPQVTATARADDDTHLKLHIDVKTGATAGSLNVTIQAGPELAVGTGLFTVIKPGPRITIAPSGAAAPAANVPLTITGTGTHFKQAAIPAVKFSPDITLAAPLKGADSDTQLTLTVNIAAKAATGPSDVTVVSGSETVTGKFIVNPDAPALLTVTPAGFQPGETYHGVIISGKNARFGASSVITFSGTGLTATDVTLPDPNDPTKLAFTLNVSADAASSGSAAPAEGSKGTNIYAIAGSKLAGLKILAPQVAVTLYGDTYATFSLTDDQAQRYKNILVQRGNEYRLVALPTPPTAAAQTTGAK